MKFITTGQTRSDAKRKLQIMVDDEDYDFLNQFNWQVDSFNCVKCHWGQKGMLIHRLIMKVSDNLEVDHIDGNRLNNQKSNLRLATSSQNKCNIGLRKDNTSGHKGVSWHKKNKNWVTRVNYQGIKRFQGSFSSKEEAIKAYNEAAKRFQGDFAFMD